MVWEAGMAHAVKSTRQDGMLPTTVLGTWSLRLLVAFAACLGLFAILVASGQRGGDSLFDNLWLLGSMGGAALCSMGAGIVGVLAMRRQGDRSFAVMLAVVMGAISLFWFSAELLLPH